MIVSTVYFYKQHCVHFVETTCLLFTLFCNARNPTILSRRVQTIFHQSKVLSIMFLNRYSHNLLYDLMKMHFDNKFAE